MDEQVERLRTTLVWRVLVSPILSESLDCIEDHGPHSM
jgi:hypothetical protein